MKLLKYIIALTLFCCYTSFSQTNTFDVAVKYGPVANYEKNIDFGNVFGPTTDYITTAISTNNKNTVIKLRRFDLDMNLLKSRDVKLESEGKELEYHTIFESNNQYYILLTFKNQKLKKHILFIQSIDIERLTLNDDLRVLDTVSYPNTWKNNSGVFNFVPSNDESKILIYSLSPKIKNKPQTIKISVYDSTIEEIWSNELNLSDIDKRFYVDEVEVHNDGNVFLLAKHATKEGLTKIKNGKLKLSYKLIYLNGKDQMKIHNIEHENYLAESLFLDFDKENNLVCSGYYSLKKDIINNGTYFSRLNGLTGELITEKYSPFSKSNLYADNADKDPYLKRFSLKGVVTFDNNETFLLGEYFRMVFYESGPEFKTKITHGNICIIKLTDSGDIAWVRFVDKLQSTESSTYYSSFQLNMRNDNKVYFIYNDQSNNKSTKRVTCIDLDGNITEGNIESDSESDKMRIERNSIIYLDKETVMIYLSNKKSFRMAKLSY